ncbi:DUF5988 family protein [Streptomyces monomycini]|uniref:DUF5988 family protein n=1 Tax=Streptomyces monomycini TaxID=371720 RepID=UPI0004A9E933|nr:DUF5988 family protein [Streptomyces monomycini]
MSEADIIPGNTNAFLWGGPATLPQIVPVAEAVIADSDRLVIAHRGRNEHFVFTGRLRCQEGMAVPVAEWVYSTAIAE